MVASVCVYRQMCPADRQKTLWASFPKHRRINPQGQFLLLWIDSLWGSPHNTAKVPQGYISTDKSPHMVPLVNTT